MVMSISKVLHRASVVAVAARLSAPVAAFHPAISNTFSQTSSTHRRSFAVRSTGPLYSSPPTRYLLSYDYIPDVLEKRVPFREGHVGLAKEMIEEGTCVSGGPTLPPGEAVPNGALFIFTTKESAEKFVAEDPYVSNGIVTGHSIAEWSVVVGSN
eukprot:CAMPEP_0172306428 /NCGR_PEP_ID=MMETSP1058-20130122/7504_1 /TAXON_ID=83371 /ORGANISM="Detonula confervacea, Strain CCMP 353" /LENGTH=154 /DNA_ID=CAMNT_0013018317 /DNA_START=104 /DNA_END=568 /DNA_ORIENTATION=+